MAEIVPAILPKSFRDLEEKVGIVVGLSKYVHIDITDGTLTERANWPYAKDNEEFNQIKSEERGLPYWEDLSFEAHLMVKNPEAVYEEWIRAGVERLIIHIESFETSEKLSEFLLKLQKHFSLKDSDFGLEVGLAVTFQTPIASILPHVSECNFVHLLSVGAIGGQGYKFEEGIFDKIKELRVPHPEVTIAIDGGVSLENIERLVEAGANRLIVGSAIYAAESPVDALEDFLVSTE